MNQENQNVETVSPEKNEAAVPEKKETANKKPEKPKPTAAELARMVSKGEMRLAAPIRANGKDVTALQFDFTKLTGWEFAQALDRDETGRTNAFRLTQMQAIELFAAAAAKMTPDVDVEDIRHRMGIEDAIKAAQISASFFNFSSRAANTRITS